MMGWDTAIYLLIASFLLSAALAPKAKAPEPVAFKDIDFPTFDEGMPQAVIFGDCWSGDWCVIGLGGYRTSAIHADGGK
jgi:hypothetical protein